MTYLRLWILLVFGGLGVAFGTTEEPQSSESSPLLVRHSHNVQDSLQALRWHNLIQRDNSNRPKAQSMHHRSKRSKSDDIESPLLEGPGVVYEDDHHETRALLLITFHNLSKITIHIETQFTDFDTFTDLILRPLTVIIEALTRYKTDITASPTSRNKHSHTVTLLSTLLTDCHTLIVNSLEEGDWIAIRAELQSALNTAKRYIFNALHHQHPKQQRKRQRKRQPNCLSRAICCLTCGCFGKCC